MSIKLNLSRKSKYILIFIFVGCTALFFRFWHIEFGLPHSFYADEPELVEPAIKYTYEIRDVIKNNNWFKLIPVSYVYGTFPVYVFTILSMFFSKSLGILGIPFEKMHMYVFLRSFTALLSFSLVPVWAILFYKIFNNRFGVFITAFLLALNWKFVSLSHYANSDIIITFLLGLSFLTLFKFCEGKRIHLYTILTGLLFGFAVGTKITVLIAIPLYLYVFVVKKDLKALLAFCFVVLGAFMFSNPFSITFFSDFVFRVYEMLFKEAGMVFDSVDTNPFKYFTALSCMSTLPVFLISVYGATQSLREDKDKSFHIFLIGNVLVYMVFYSLQARRVDRWLLPILPIVFFYAAFAVAKIGNFVGTRRLWSRCLWALVLAFSAVYYTYFPFHLLCQFKRYTPKSEAYIWMRDNIYSEATKLIYTEEGLDPMNKLTRSRGVQFQVYESEGAGLFFPENPYLYDYIVLSSRPMQNYKKPQVREKYPSYYEAWSKFEKTVTSSGDFDLIKTFTTPKPNLIPLSDVYIYKRL